MNDNDTPAPSEQDGIPTDRRPLGFWLRTVDHLITREFAAALSAEGVDRRDWMLLNVIAGDVDTAEPAVRLSRGGKRLHRLEDLGWIDEVEGSWVLTDAGRAARDRIGELVSGIRGRVAGAVSAEDFATLTASLEAIARELGWDESAKSGRWDRRFGPGRAFGPGRGFGFGPGRAFGPGRGFGAGFGSWAGPGSDAEDGPCSHEHRGHHGHHGHGEHHGHHGHGEHHRHGGHQPEHAFERGFTAGFAAGQGSGTTAPADVA